MKKQSEKPSKNKYAQNLVPSETINSYPYADKVDLLTQLNEHLTDWQNDNDQRRDREGGWTECMDAYWGKLPEDWPFTSEITDPRIRTSLLEKNARLTNRTLKGRVIPRDQESDPLKARIINTIIDYQWDSANDGGSMQEKISNTDLDTRWIGSKFAYVYWKTEYEGSELTFDGNEMKPLDIEDCGMDPNANHIRNAKWFQHRIWMPWEDLELNKDMYPGYAALAKLTKNGTKINQTRRDNKYLNRVKTIKGLEDRMGTDNSFPIIQVVIEYRRDKFITFCPDYDIILSEIENPYDHKKIPIAQNRYYPINGDPLGESEIEPVLPLWKSIQAILCSMLDESILKMRPPLKVVDGAVRTETLIYQPEAQWLMDNVNAVTEMESRADSIRYFQSVYPALISAFNVAMGDMSQGISNTDPMNQDKTATEVRQIAKQQNTRDQKNQQALAEFIKDIVSMWISNNKQFLFRNPKKKEHIMRILGNENFSYFKRSGLDEMVVPDEAMPLIQETITNAQELGQQMTESDIQTMYDSVKVPKHPVLMNPEEDNVDNMNFKPKMTVNEMGDSAELSIVPEDLDGSYDYVPDMKSMEVSAADQKIFARMQAIQQITNPNIMMMLQQEGIKPRIKDLLIANFEDTGLEDAQKFFESIGAAQLPPQAAGQVPGQPGSQPPAANTPTGSTLPTQQVPGMAGVPQAPSQPSVDQQMALTNRV